VPTKAMMAAASEYFMMNTDGLPKLYHEVSVDANGPALAASFIASLLESLEPQSSMRATVRCLISHIRGRKNDGKISKENTKIADALEGWLETGNLRGTVRQALLSECMKITSLCCNHTWTGVPGDDWRFVLEQLDSVSTQNFKDLAYDARFIKLLRKGTLLNQRLGEAWRLYGQYQGAEKAVSDALLQEHFSMSVAKPTGIQLMTLHKSKGKQFDEVVMAEGYHQDRYLNFRGNQPTDNDKERSRLLLRVGATRAVRRATILTPAGKMSCPLLLYEI
jgi:DNA helicase-2/ATP-dependent DNA helicase PcrA